MGIVAAGLVPLMQECLNAGLVELAMHVLSTATICDFMTAVLHVRRPVAAAPVAACVCMASDGADIAGSCRKGCSSQQLHRRSCLCYNTLRTPSAAWAVSYTWALQAVMLLHP